MQPQNFSSFIIEIILLKQVLLKLLNFVFILHNFWHIFISRKYHYYSNFLCRYWNLDYNPISELQNAEYLGRNFLKFIRLFHISYYFSFRWMCAPSCRKWKCLVNHRCSSFSEGLENQMQPGVHHLWSW